MEKQDNIKEISHKKLITGILMIVVLSLVTVELPYLDKSFIQMILPNVAFTNKLGLSSVWHLSSMVSVIVILIAVSQIHLSHKFNANVIVIFFIVIYMVFPFMQKSVESVESIIYRSQDGVNSIQMVDSDINIINWGDAYDVMFSFEVKSYKGIKPKDITLILPIEHEHIYKNRIIHLEDGMWGYSDGNLQYRQSLDLDFYDDVHDDISNNINNDHYNYTIVLKYNDEELEYIRNDFY